MAEALNLTTAHVVWQSLEHAYNHDSMERVHTLRDSLRQMTKGNSSVSDFGRQFKVVCDKLAVVGHSVEDMDKVHWFLCGLDFAFESFCTAHRAVIPCPSFHTLLSHAESHELFLKLIQNHATTATVAFTVQTQPSSKCWSNTRGRGSQSRGGFSGGRGRGRRPPHC